MAKVIITTDAGQELECIPVDIDDLLHWRKRRDIMYKTMDRCEDAVKLDHNPQMMGDPYGD